MRRNSVPLFVLLLLVSFSAVAQVVAPVEIKDPALRNLQQEYMDDLTIVGQEIVTSNFTYAFYLSRKLDIDEQQQKASDQRSIRFDHFNGKTVLAITGNYYAAYSTEKLNEQQRARATFLKVVMPLLKAAVQRFQNNKNVQGYALEISHHILGKVMNVFDGAPGKPCGFSTPGGRSHVAFRQRRRCPAGCSPRGPSLAQRRTCHYLA
jgi:hypothetical protein